MQLLQETFIIEQLQVLSEGKANGPMKIRGVFGRCNEKNNNGRIYPTAVLESQLSKVQPLINERRLCGELDHPQNDTVKLSNASHLITKLDMKGNELIGEAEILKTPAGLTAKALVEGGVKIGISSRGMGTLSENETGDKIVNEDFRLVTFDLVADPSTRGAFPGLSESTESQFVQESQSKLKKESTFVTMLESKMRDAYSPWIEEAKSKKKKALTSSQKKQLDKNNNNKIDGEDFDMLRKESMNLVRNDGHWHRIAEMIIDGLGAVDEEFAETLDKTKAERHGKTQATSTRRQRRTDVLALRKERVQTSRAARKNKASRAADKAKKDATKRGGRRSSDTGGASERRSGSAADREEAQVDHSVYRQIGSVLTEVFTPDTQSQVAAIQGKGLGFAAGERLRGLRKHTRGTMRDQRKHDAKSAKGTAIAAAQGAAKAQKITAKGQVKADKIGQKGSLKSAQQAAKDATTLQRTQHQQTNRQARQQDTLSRAKPGSIASQGVGGAARELGGRAVAAAANPGESIKKAIGFAKDKYQGAKRFVGIPDKKNESAAYKRLGNILADSLGLKA